MSSSKIHTITDQNPYLRLKFENASVLIMTGYDISPKPPQNQVRIYAEQIPELIAALDEYFKSLVRGEAD